MGMDRVKIERAVTVNVEAAHRHKDGRLHGHSYTVECWTDRDIDLVDFEAMAREAASVADHSVLEQTIGAPSMEAMAGWFLERLGLTRVVVRRPTLGYAVECRKE